MKRIYLKIFRVKVLMGRTLFYFEVFLKDILFQISICAYVDYIY